MGKHMPYNCKVLGLIPGPIMGKGKRESEGEGEGKREEEIIIIMLNSKEFKQR